MQHDVPVGEALGLPRAIKRIEGHAAVIHGYKDAFALGTAAKCHAAAQPALYSAALVVIAARAFVRESLAAFEAVDVKLAHIAADFFEALYKLSVGHALAPSRVSYETIPQPSLPRISFSFFVTFRRRFDILCAKLD